LSSPFFVPVKDLPTLSSPTVMEHTPPLETPLTGVHSLFLGCVLFIPFFFRSPSPSSRLPNFDFSSPVPPSPLFLNPFSCPYGTSFSSSFFSWRGSPPFVQRSTPLPLAFLIRLFRRGLTCFPPPRKISAGPFPPPLHRVLCFLQFLFSPPFILPFPQRVKTPLILPPLFISFFSVRYSLSV